MVEGFVGLREHAGEELVDVRGSGDHVQADVNLLLRGAGREAERVVEQDLGRADLDQQRRQTGQLREQRAGQFVAWILTAR